MAILPEPTSSLGAALERERAHAPHLRRLLTLLGLWALAVAQPILDLVGRQPQYLLEHRVEGTAVAVFALGLTLAAPLAAWGLVAVASAVSRRAGSALHALFCGTLLAALALELLRHLPLPDGAVLALAGVAAVVALAAAARWPPLRDVGAALAVAALVVPSLFLLGSRARGLLLPHGTAAVGARSIARPAPVIVLVFDELPLVTLLGPDGRIDAGRYPSFARLAAVSHWFRNATSVAPSTDYAVPAILCGQYPKAPKLPRPHDYPRTLFTLLGGRYAMNVQETSLVQLCPDALCGGGLVRDRRRLWSALASDTRLVFLHLVLPGGRERSLPPIDAAWGDFTRGVPTGSGSASGGPAATPRARATEPEAGNEAQLARLLGGIETAEPGSPSLHYAHFNLPHGPWRHLPSGREYKLDPHRVWPEGHVGGVWGAEEWPIALAWQRHLSQVGYADRLLGRILDAAERRGTLDGALVVVTADHGMAFGSGEPLREVSPGNWTQVLPVPLLVKLPGQRAPVVDERNAETIDILPTIADVVGAQAGWSLDGVSLVRPALPARARPHKRLFNFHRDGPSMTFPPRADLGPALRRKLALFGWSGDDRLFAAGPHPELLGRDASTLAAATPAVGLATQLDRPGAFKRIRRRGALPALVGGGVSAGSRPLPLALAITIDGVVRATAWTHHDARGRLRFMALLPEESLAPGSHRAEVFLLEESAGVPRLLPLQTGIVVPYQLVPGGIHEVGRRTYRIVPGAVAGEVREEAGELRGWAGDIAHRRAARLVVVTVAGSHLASTRPDEPSSQVAGVLGRWAKRMGFRVALPPELRRGMVVIRVFAIAGEVASELEYPQGWRFGHAAVQARRAAARGGKALRDSTSPRRTPRCAQNAASPPLKRNGKQPIHTRWSRTSSIRPPTFSAWKTPWLKSCTCIAW